MILIQRHANGEIIGIRQDTLDDSASKMSEWQTVSEDEPEVEEFISKFYRSTSPESHPSQALGQTDLALARVLEDLIDLLVDRSMIRFTDFPLAAQAKLRERHNARHALRQLHLLTDEANIDDETL